MSSFWEIMWLMIWTFVFIAYLFVLFQIVVDLFRDPGLGGFAKALWVIGLIFLPFLTALIYIIARGKGMGHRQLQAIHDAKTETEAYIRSIAGKSAAEQIADAKKLLDAGTISNEEFIQLKAKALG